MNYLNKLISDLSKELNQKKEEILKEKLASLKINIDWGEEEKRRFKSITLEIQEGEESYYYDNGSIKGIRIVTFQAPTSTHISDKILSEVKYF